MKAQPVYGLDLSWPRVTAVFLFDVAALSLASHWPGDPRAASYVWWSGVGVAVLVTAAVLITYRRIALASALVARVRDRFADPESFLTEGRTPAVDHCRRYGHDLVGIREYQGQLVTVIGVEAAAAARPDRRHRKADRATVLSMGPLANALRQFDVRLDGIDVVSVGTRGARGTWLVLRMDSQHNVGAVAARDSLAATMAAATERLAHHLDRRNVTARILTAEEFVDVDNAVLAGLQPERVRLRRRRLKQKAEGSKEFVASFWMSPRDISSENLEQVWDTETDTTAVTLQLTAWPGRTAVSVLIRYHSTGKLPRSVWAGLNRLTGRQLTAVRVSLPTALPRTLALPSREFAEHHDLDGLEIPLDATSQRAMAEAGTQP